MTIRVAARKSDLARLQAYRVGEALQSRFSNLQIEYFFSTSLGDQNQESPLWKMPEKGVFTEDLTKKLIQGECDVVVHSWKDLPTEDRDQTEVVATLPRADSRDLIIFRKERCDKKIKNLKVFSSSPRRILNVGEFLSWSLPFQTKIEFQSVRGNIPTRVNKLLSGEADALVLAKAAVDRLLTSHESEFLDVREVLQRALAECRWMVLPLTVNPCAPAQGALAIEILKSRTDLNELLDQINCAKTYQSVQHERDVLKKYGGGCHQKIGVAHLNLPFGEVEILRGQAESDGSQKGQHLDSVSFKNVNHVDVNIDVDCTKIFPLKMTDSVFYKRVPRSVDYQILKNRNLWVAKAEAWPEGYISSVDQIIWTSGLTTWRKLAAQGIWVNGSQESFGEDFHNFENIESLAGVPPHFMKLTHNEAVGLSKNDLCVTYDLVDIAKVPDLNGKTHFFWASFSSFRRAVEKYPEIRAAQHACGPGHTYKQISNYLKGSLHKKINLSIFLSHKDWRKNFGG